MNCDNLAQLLDDQGPGLLDETGLLAAADAHAGSCSDCRAALTAVRALAADPVPAPVALEARIRRAIGNGRTRRARPRLALSAALVCAGAAFAGAAWYVADRLQGVAAGAQSADAAASGERQSAAPAAAAADAAASIASVVDAAETRTVESWYAGILDALPDGEYFALLRVPPLYPRAAAEQGLEGEVIVEFTISETGDVQDATVVESSDPLFDAPTIDSTSRQKYKPRVVDGRGVEVSGVRNIVRYQLEQPAGSAPAQDAEPANEAAEAGSPPVPAGLGVAEYSAALGPAYGCLEAGDLRCMELELDRVLATYELSPQQEAQIWHFYGFLHHRRGRYELAIEAYRNATRTAATEPSYLNLRPLMIIAYIHYELQQYQEAMDAASEYLRRSGNTLAADYLFVEKLRSFGAIAP